MIWHYGAEIQAQALFILQLHLNAVIWNGCLICLPPEVRLLLILRFTFESVGTCKRIMRPGEKSRQKKALLSFPFETALKKKNGPGLPQYKFYERSRPGVFVLWKA